MSSVCLAVCASLGYYRNALLSTCAEGDDLLWASAGSDIDAAETVLLAASAFDFVPIVCMYVCTYSRIHKGIDTSDNRDNWLQWLSCPVSP